MNLEALSLIKHLCHVLMIDDICTQMALIHSLMDITGCKQTCDKKLMLKTCVKNLIFIYFHYFLSNVLLGKGPLKRTRMVRWVPESCQFPSKMIPCRWVHLPANSYIAMISAFIETTTKKQQMMNHLCQIVVKIKTFEISLVN